MDTRVSHGHPNGLNPMIILWKIVSFLRMDLWLLLGIIAEILRMKGEHGVIQWTWNFAGSIATFHHVPVSIL